jgi:hypothetical protein
MRYKYNVEGWTQANLSRLFQVSVNTVGRIVNELTWQHIAGAGMPEVPVGVSRHDRVEAPREHTAAEMEAFNVRMGFNPDGTARVIQPREETELERKAKAFGAKTIMPYDVPPTEEYSPGYEKLMNLAGSSPRTLATSKALDELMEVDKPTGDLE